MNTFRDIHLQDFSIDEVQTQVVFDTLCNNWRVAFRKWEFDQMKLSNFFLTKQVHFTFGKI